MSDNGRRTSYPLLLRLIDLESRSREVLREWLALEKEREGVTRQFVQERLDEEQVSEHRGSRA